MLHAASCCQRGLRRNSCCFVWPAWCSRYFIYFRDMWPAWYPRYFMLFGFSFSVNHAEVCVIEGKLFLVTSSGGTVVRMIRKGAKRWLTFRLSKRNSAPSSFWATLIGYVDIYQPNADIRPKCWGIWQNAWGGVRPKSGLGSAATARYKAFKESRQIMKNRICFTSFDEVSAADGPCPREQIADASGIVVGGTVLQMIRGLSRAPT